MARRLLNVLLDWLLSYLGLERKAKRDDEERKAADESVARGNAAAAVISDSVPEHDKYARD